MTNQFIVLDPRPASSSNEMERIVSLRKDGYFIIGVEVTIPDIAALCDINIDPQHSWGRPEESAIRYTMDRGAYELGELINMGGFGSQWAFITVRPDLDSVGSMALLDHVSREANYPVPLTDEEKIKASSRVESIHIQDTFAMGGWKPSSLEEIGGNAELGAVTLAISDFKVSLDKRVGLMKEFLFTGEFPGQEDFHAKWKQGQEAIKAAIDSGETVIEDHGYIAVIRSSLRSALAIGYTAAPVVVAVNEDFRFPSGEIGRKFTISQYKVGWVDLANVSKQLSEKEPGWGGSPTILGSPQGESSNLPLETVVREVANCFLAH